MIFVYSLSLFLSPCTSTPSLYPSLLHLLSLPEGVHWDWRQDEICYYIMQVYRGLAFCVDANLYDVNVCNIYWILKIIQTASELSGSSDKSVSESAFSSY